MEQDAVGLTDTISILSAQMSELWEATIRVMPSFIIGLLVFLIFFLLAKPFSALLVHPIAYISSSNLVQNVIRRIISLFIILVGLYIFLNIYLFHYKRYCMSCWVWASQIYHKSLVHAEWKNIPK